jgi:LEA14-like dessication related protein
MHTPSLCAALLVLTACQSVREVQPVVERVRPRITGIDLSGLAIAFDVDVRNPLPVALETPRFGYSLEVEGTTLVSTKDAAGVDLPAEQTGTATIPVRVEYGDLAEILGSLSGRNEAAYAFEGAFHVPVLGGSFDLPFAHEGTLPIVRPPSFSVVDVSTSDVSFSGATVSVEADMTNPNVFGIDLADVGYTLRLAGARVARLSVSTGGEVRAGATRRLALTGSVSAQEAVARLIEGARLEGAEIVATGRIATPWGPLRLRR